MEDEGNLKAYPFAPILSVGECQLTPPSLLDNASDWDRLRPSLRATSRRLPWGDPEPARRLAGGKLAGEPFG